MRDNTMAEEPPLPSGSDLVIEGRSTMAEPQRRRMHGQAGKGRRAWSLLSPRLFQF
jgi:hypothetical protein